MLDRLNVPYFGSWTEITEAGRERGTSSIKGVSDRYVELKTLYADNDLDFEADAYYFDEMKNNPPEFMTPEEAPEIDRSAPEVANWPFDAETARAMQGEPTPVNDAAKTGEPFGIEVRSAQMASVTLSDEVAFDMVKIPAGSFVMGDEEGFNDEFPRSAVTIDKPFWMATTETTNAMYALFDASMTAGTSTNGERPCSARISCKSAEPAGHSYHLERSERILRLVERKTGKKFRLPTEAEWEWTRRRVKRPCGTAASTTISPSSKTCPTTRRSNSSFRASIRSQFRIRPSGVPSFRAKGVDDGAMIGTGVGSYAPNAWGLYDMLGNVAEWTASDYKAYPYVADDGRNDGDLNAKKVAKGGSWRDRPKWARAGLRRDYESWQPVFNVGFRVVCEDDFTK